MNLLRAIVSLIDTLLNLVANLLVSGIGLLVTVITICVVAAVFGSGSIAGIFSVRALRKRKREADGDR